MIVVIKTPVTVLIIDDGLFVRTQIVNVGHTIKVIVTVVVAVTVHPLHHEGKSGRISAQTNGSREVAVSNKPRNHLHIKMCGVVKHGGGNVQPNGCLVGGWKQIKVARVDGRGKHRWRTVALGAVSQQHPTVVQPHLELKVVHHHGFGFGWKGHPDSDVFTTYRGKASFPPVAGLKKGARSVFAVPWCGSN